MKTELYKAIKSIEINNLTTGDKIDLLNIFKVIENPLIRDQLAFFFSDLHYNEAVPFIFERINEKEAYVNNGSLVYALQDLDTRKFFFETIRIICEMDYEARLGAYEIVEKYVGEVSAEEIKAAFEILEFYRIQEENSSDKGENSKLHFIEQTEKLLLKR